jgi:hypothetical protein
MSTASILARLARLERALHIDEPVDDRSREQVLKQLDIMGDRMRAEPGWTEPTPEQIEKTKRDFVAMMEAMRANA